MIKTQEKVIFTIENDNKIYDSTNQNIIILLPELIEHNKEQVKKNLISTQLSQYKTIDPFHEGLAVARLKINDFAYIYIDKNGTQVVPGVYLYAHKFNEGLALVSKEKNQYAFIDRTGNAIINNLTAASDFHEGLAAVKINNKWGYINKKGEIEIACKYKNASNFNNSVALVQNKNGRGFYINKQGKKINYQNYNTNNSLTKIDNELTPIINNGLWGYVNNQGETIIPFVYNYAQKFSEGIAFVSDENGKYLIDKTGSPITFKSSLKKLKLLETIIAKLTNDQVIYALDINNAKLYFVNSWNKETNINKDLKQKNKHK